METINGTTVIPGQYIVPTHKETDGSVHVYISSRGTRISELEVDGSVISVITSTLLGKVFIHPGPPSEDNQQETKFFVYVVSAKNLYVENVPDITKIGNNIPKEGNVVLVRIVKLNQQQSYCEILAVEGSGNVIQDLGIGTNGELAHLSLGMGGGSQALTHPSTIASSQSTNLNAMSIDVGETFKGVIRSQDVRLTERDKVKIFECFKPGDIVRAEILSLGDGANYYLSTAKNDLGVIYTKSDGGAGYPMFPIDWQHMMCPITGTIEMRKCAKPFN